MVPPLESVPGADAAFFGDVPPALWVPALEGTARRDLGARLRQELRERPTPIRPEGPAHEARAALEETLGWVEVFEEDDAERLLRVERRRWLAGGDLARYCEQLRRFGEGELASALARTTLARVPPVEPALQSRLEAFLTTAEPVPGSWRRAIDALRREPSREAMTALLRFTPPERREAQLRLVLEALEAAGVPEAERFVLAAVAGPGDEAARLAESGLVPPGAIEAEATRDSAAWLGLAARATCVRGDRLGTVRLLRRAPARRPSDLLFVAEHADAELRRMLDGAGIALPGTRS